MFIETLLCCVGSELDSPSHSLLASSEDRSRFEVGASLETFVGVLDLKLFALNRFFLPSLISGNASIALISFNVPVMAVFTGADLNSLACTFAYAVSSGFRAASTVVRTYCGREGWDAIDFIFKSDL